MRRNIDHSTIKKQTSNKRYRSMPSSIPRRVVSFRNISLVAAVLFAGLAIALTAWPSPSAAAVTPPPFADTLAAWSFDGVTTTNPGQTPSITGGSATADSGVLTAGSAFTGFHTTAATAWSNPAGNGSPKALSSNNWGVGDYYQFSFSTSGYGAISITWDQTGSATGPEGFQSPVQYRRVHLHRCDRH